MQKVRVVHLLLDHVFFQETFSDIVTHTLRVGASYW